MAFSKVSVQNVGTKLILKTFWFIFGRSMVRHRGSSAFMGTLVTPSKGSQFSPYQGHFCPKWYKLGISYNMSVVLYLSIIMLESLFILHCIGNLWWANWKNLCSVRTFGPNGDLPLTSYKHQQFFVLHLPRDFWSKSNVLQELLSAI